MAGVRHSTLCWYCKGGYGQVVRATLSGGGLRGAAVRICGVCESGVQPLADYRVCGVVLCVGIGLRPPPPSVSFPSLGVR